MAGTNGIFRRGQNHHEMPAGTAYHHKERNKERFWGIVFINEPLIYLNFKSAFCAFDFFKTRQKVFSMIVELLVSKLCFCVDVQKKATAWEQKLRLRLSEKPRRKACSV